MSWLVSCWAGTSGNGGGGIGSMVVNARPSIPGCHGPRCLVHAGGPSARTAQFLVPARQGHTASGPRHGSWWQVQQYNVHAALLPIDRSKLQGLSLTAQTGCVLRLTVVSPDGVQFPDTPEGFQAELLRHA